MNAAQTPAIRRQATAQVHDLRACELCDHSTTVAGELHCTQRTVCGPHPSVPCSVARYGARAETGEVGGCGRDAAHMVWAPLTAAGRPLRAALWAAAA